VTYLHKQIAELDKRSSYALDEWCVINSVLCVSREDGNELSTEAKMDVVPPMNLYILVSFKSWLLAILDLTYRGEHECCRTTVEF